MNNNRKKKTGKNKIKELRFGSRNVKKGFLGQEKWQERPKEERIREQDSQKIFLVRVHLVVASFPREENPQSLHVSPDSHPSPAEHTPIPSGTSPGPDKRPPDPRIFISAISS